MNYYYFLFLIGFLLACSPVKNADKESSAEEKAFSDVQWLNMEGDEGKPHIVLVSGDEEYRSEEALPMLAKILSKHHGFKCTVLFAQDPETPGIVDPNYVGNIPGLEHLAEADMMILFTRFRALPDDQMKHIDDYLKSGKPLIGIRTSTHAFNFKPDSESAYKHFGNYYNEDDEWKGGFGRLVLGEKWISHHGHHKHQSTRGIPAPGAEDHPILNGIGNGEIWGSTDVYGVRLPLPGDAQPIVLGQVVNRPGAIDTADVHYGMRPTDNEIPGPVTEKDENGKSVKVDKNNPMMPIAWTKSYQIPGGQKGKVFASTIGSSTDMLSEGVRRMMVNATFWGLDLPVPSKADVSFIGDYEYSAYAFHDDLYWDNKALTIQSLGR